MSGIKLKSSKVWYNLIERRDVMSVKNFIMICIVSFITSLLITSIIVVNAELLNINHNIGLSLCNSLGIPPYLELSIMSPGILIDIVIVMFVIEEIILIPYFKLVGYICNKLHDLTYLVY